MFLADEDAASTVPVEAPDELGAGSVRVAVVGVGKVEEHARWRVQNLVPHAPASVHSGREAGTLGLA